VNGERLAGCIKRNEGSLVGWLELRVHKIEGRNLPERNMGAGTLVMQLALGCLTIQAVRALLEYRVPR
jgi:hypothetical protein